MNLLKINLNCFTFVNSTYKMVTVGLTRTQKFNFYLGFPGNSCGKESACQWRREGFNPLAGKVSWRRKWQPTPVFLPGISRGQRSLVGYSPWGLKESRHDWTTEQKHENVRENWQYLTIYWASCWKNKSTKAHRLPWQASG